MASIDDRVTPAALEVRLIVLSNCDIFQDVATLFTRSCYVLLRFVYLRFILITSVAVKQLRQIGSIYKHVPSSFINIEIKRWLIC